MKGFLDCSPVLVSGWSLFSSWSLEFCLRRSGAQMMLSVLVVYFLNSSGSWLHLWRDGKGSQSLGSGCCWFVPMSCASRGGWRCNCCHHGGHSDAGAHCQAELGFSGLHFCGKHQWDGSMSRAQRSRSLCRVLWMSHLYYKEVAPSIECCAYNEMLRMLLDKNVSCVQPS